MKDDLVLSILNLRRLNLRVPAYSHFSASAIFAWAWFRDELSYHSILNFWLT